MSTELSSGGQLRSLPGENIARMRLDLALPDAESYAPDTLSRIRKHSGTDLVVLGSYLAMGKKVAINSAWIFICRMPVRARPWLRSPRLGRSRVARLGSPHWKAGCGARWESKLQPKILPQPVLPCPRAAKRRVCMPRVFPSCVSSKLWRREACLKKRWHSIRNTPSAMRLSPMRLGVSAMTRRLATRRKKPSTCPRDFPVKIDS